MRNCVRRYLCALDNAKGLKSCIELRQNNAQEAVHVLISTFGYGDISVSWHLSLVIAELNICYALSARVIHVVTTCRVFWSSVLRPASFRPPMKFKPKLHSTELDLQNRRTTVQCHWKGKWIVLSSCSIDSKVLFFICNHKSD